MSLTNWNYSLNTALCLACHLYLFCFIQSYFKNTNTVLKLRIRMNYFFYLSDFASSLLCFWVIFQCYKYSLVNLSAEMLSSKYDCSENVTTKSCHFWIGSIELLVGVLCFFHHRTLWEIFHLFIVLICFIFSNNFFFIFGLVSEGLTSWMSYCWHFTLQTIIETDSSLSGVLSMLALLLAVCSKQVEKG